MQITITIPDEIAGEVQGRLAAEAEALGIDLDRYLTEKLIGKGQALDAQKLSTAEAVDRLRELRKGNILGELSVRQLIDSGRRF